MVLEMSKSEFDNWIDGKALERVPIIKCLGYIPDEKGRMKVETFVIIMEGGQAAWSLRKLMRGIEKGRIKW